MAKHEKFLVFGQPQIGEEEIAEVVDSLRSGWLGTGPKVTRFERAFAEYKGVPSAIAVSSCTAALHLSMLAAGLKEGDEVITSALTFCATVNAITHVGATPVIADIDPQTLNIDPDDAERRITSRTRALLVVHFAGYPCEMNRFQEMADQHGLVLIEDCAHAIETESGKAKAGTMGNFGCFSFYATKNICTGEGGMVLARDERDLERLKVLALHGMSKDAWKRYGDVGFVHYDVVETGFKYNMMDLQASLGIHQLARIEKQWHRRVALDRLYRQQFADLPITIPSEAPVTGRHAHHLFCLLIDESIAGISRDHFIQAMTAKNIGVGVHYRSIPEHEYYRNRFGWIAGDYPNAFRVGQTTVSLPFSPYLSDADIECIINAVRSTLVIDRYLGAESPRCEVSGGCSCGEDLVKWGCHTNHPPQEPPPHEHAQ